MIRLKAFRFIELLFFFVAVPSLMVLEIVPRRPLVVLNVLAYTAFVILSRSGHALTTDRIRDPLRRFAFLAPAFTAVSILWLNDGFLSFPRERPVFWALVCVIYPLASVIAQEYLYRVWFWERYSLLFPSRLVMITANAVLFGYAHIVMRNWTAISWSTIGGFLFAYTYSRTRSFMPVWLEHSLWGILLFSYGWGKSFYHASP